jgi:hypothetical protein
MKSTLIDSQKLYKLSICKYEPKKSATDHKGNSKNSEKGKTIVKSLRKYQVITSTN